MISRLILVLVALLSPLAPVFASEALTDEEQKMLDHGEIPTGRYIAAGITGTLVGFGIGHGVVGHGFYKETGWIFTASEGVSAAVFLGGVFSCLNHTSLSDAFGYGNSSNYGWYDKCGSGEKTAIVVGYLSLLGFRIWEIVDIWSSPMEYNERVRNLRSRSEKPGKTSYYIMPLKIPASDSYVWKVGLAREF